MKENIRAVHVARLIRGLSCMKPWVADLAPHKTVWWYPPVIPAVRRQGQEDQKSKVILFYIDSSR